MSLTFVLTMQLESLDQRRYKVNLEDAEISILGSRGQPAKSEREQGPIIDHRLERQRSGRRQNKIES